MLRHSFQLHKMWTAELVNIRVLR